MELNSSNLNADSEANLESESFNSEQSESELMKIRRDKFEKLRQQGKNPFEITKYDIH